MNKHVESKSKLKLINNNGTLGYTINNIKAVLEPKKFAAFERWMYGQLECIKVKV